MRRSMRLIAFPAAIVVLASACAGSTAAPSLSPLGQPAGGASATQAVVATIAPTVPPTQVPTASPRPKFPHGLYYVQPTTQHPGGVIDVLEGSGPLPTRVEFVGIGYDVADDFIVVAGMGNSGLLLFGADGTQRQVPVNGLFGVGRPSLSPDGKFVVVQATETPITSGTPMPRFITDYVIDLATGAFRRLIAPGTREFAEGRELPRWLPSGDRILYQTNDFSTVEGGCDIIRVVDAASGAAVLTINDRGPGGCFSPTPASGPRFHAEPSLDSSKILIPGQMQLFDAKSGQLLADVHRQALEGLAAAGYRVDTRFPGQGGSGTFPLDGSLSPDGKTITFDGAVEKDGAFGVLLMRINVDGSGFTVVKPPFQVTPMFSNNHNFSQALPHWR